ncbi:MAG TPA: Mut7-C RNAse domain-containing protein [Bryobacteraceae bacterium]
MHEAFENQIRGGEPIPEEKLKLKLTLGGSGAFVRFYGELNDFLPPARRGRLVAHRFDVGPSVKDAIESIGVPHPEVELVVVNSQPVDFSHTLKAGDFVSVYPAFHSIDLGSLPRLRRRLEGKPRFVLDVHLGRLAAYLRLLGFDTLYENTFTDAHVAAASAGEGRIVLTRDRGLLKRNEVTYGYWVRQTEPRKQLVEALRRFDLAPYVDLFTRCLVCNTELRRVDKQIIESRVTPRTVEHFQDFHLCPLCNRVYWKGSHYRRMLLLVGRMLREART